MVANYLWKCVVTTSHGRWVGSKVPLLCKVSHAGEALKCHYTAQNITERSVPRSAAQLGRHEEHRAENCYSHLIGERLIVGSVPLETGARRRVVMAQMTAGKVEGEFWSGSILWALKLTVSTLFNPKQQADCSILVDIWTRRTKFCEGKMGLCRKLYAHTKQRVPELSEWDGDAARFPTFIARLSIAVQSCCGSVYACLRFHCGLTQPTRLLSLKCKTRRHTEHILCSGINVSGCSVCLSAALCCRRRRKTSCFLGSAHVFLKAALDPL